MKSILRKVFILILSICVCMAISHDVRAEEISGEIEVIINTNSEEMQKYKTAFEKKYPNVKVNYTTYYDYERQIYERIKTGEYGDVLYVPSAMGNEAFWKYLEPLGDIDELSEKYYFLENGWIHDSIIYGIPSHAYVNGIVYNTEVFDKAGISEIPKTMEEFREAMALIKKHTDAIAFYTNCSLEWALYPWQSFPYIEMTGDCTYKYNEFIFQKNPFSQGSSHYEVYKLLYDIVKDGYTEKDVTKSDWDTTCRLLNSGKIGCIAIGSWAIDQIKASGIKGENIAFMPFPNNINGKQYLSAVMDFSYGISSKSKNKQAAKAYLDFMLEESGYALDHENISPLKTDPYPKSFQNLGNIEVQSEIVIYDEKWSYYKALSKDLNLEDMAEIQRIIKAGAGIEAESFDDIMQEWNERWEKNRTTEIKKSTSNKNENNPLTMFSYEKELQLSDNEKEFIKENPIIKVGYVKDLAPFSIDEAGSFSGVSYEICEEIKNWTGLKMQYIGYDSTSDMLKDLNNQKIDMSACIEKHTAYDIKPRYSKEYIVYADALIKKGEFSLEISDSGNAAAVSGEEKDYWSSIDNISFYDNLTDCINSIEKGENDYTITNFYTANYYVRKNMNKGISIIPSTKQESMHFAFGSQVNDTLVAVINKCIYNLPESNVELFVQKYMNVDTGRITLKRFVEENVMMSIGITATVFAIILILVIIILLERNKNTQIVIRRKAETDPLTSLYNREGMKKRINELEAPFMLAVLDIDDFKKVNDTLGHAGGDAALKLLAENLKRCMGENAVLVRYGGDEFVILMSRVSEQEVRERLAALIKAMDTQMTYEGVTKGLSISLGGVYCIHENAVFEELFKEADKELYNVKQSGKNGYSLKQWN